jgi:hypothetical protein
MAQGKWFIEGSISMGNLDVFKVDELLGNYRVCMVECDDDTVSEGDVMANARLIAAAPDLLAALEGALDALRDSGEYPETARLARAAINKSRGIPDK